MSLSSPSLSEETGCWWDSVTHQTPHFRSWPTSMTGKATPLMTPQTTGQCRHVQSWRRGLWRGSTSLTMLLGKFQSSDTKSLCLLQDSLLYDTLSKSHNLFHLSPIKPRLLWLYLRARHGRDGHSYCSAKGCERVKVMATTSSKQICNCSEKAYPKYSKTPSAVVPMPALNTQPCKGCGAKQVHGAIFNMTSS